MTTIPVLIITGFLGSGKTSLLRHLLPLCGEAGLRPALIINEVGTVDVDGQLLADLHAEQARLVGGCVCCTLQAQLATTIHDLLDRQAGDIIIIECSGVSNPLDVVNVLSTPALVSRVAVSHILCLFDAARAEKVQLSELARSQAKAADTLVLNKIDRLDTAKRDTVRSLADTLNPHAQKFWCEHGDLGHDVLFTLLASSPSTWKPYSCGHAQCQHDHTHTHTHALPASFCTVALPLPAPMSRTRLDELMHALPDNVIRAKGFGLLEEEGWHVIHKVYDTVDLYPHTGPSPSTGALLICIGEHLQPALLQQLLTDGF